MYKTQKAFGCSMETSNSLLQCNEDVAQDSNCVMGVIDSVLSFINVNFEQPQLSFRSDNAGCYHSQELICLLSLFASKHKVMMEMM